MKFKRLVVAEMLRLCDDFVALHANAIKVFTMLIDRVFNST
jgi:hypothetical protein